MKLGLLFKDELLGFYKSKVMIFLWIGLPVIALLFRFLRSPLGKKFLAIFPDSFNHGTLAAVMLSSPLLMKTTGVYDLSLLDH
jgi:hypothetical protein